MLPKKKNIKTPSLDNIKYSAPSYSTIPVKKNKNFKKNQKTKIH